MVNLTLENLDSQATTKKSRWRWGRSQIGDFRYYLFRLCVICQVLTVLITWDLWQVRETPPLLPVFDWLPQFSFGPTVLLSLLYVFLDPKRGLFAHAAVLIVASCFDQTRMQPQFMAIWMMMFATVFELGTRIGRWFLVSMWIWAGIHKALSPDWMGMGAWSLVEQARWDGNSYYLYFAVMVASSEIIAGLFSIVKPRWGVLICPALHLGIIVFLSPFFIDWNRSVFPWNFCTAIVGAWIMWECKSILPTSRLEWACVAAFFILPFGFYYSWMDHGYSNVLYSDNLPQAIITNPDGSSYPIVGWGKLRVPFPNERRLFRSYFSRVAEAGAKMHLYDPRVALDDQFLQMDPSGELVEIGKDEFFSANDGSCIGVSLDSERSIFKLGFGGVKLLKRTPTSGIYAVRFDPELFEPELLDQLHRLKNIEQIQLAGCDLGDEDLYRLSGLWRLSGIGLSNTRVTDEGLKSLGRFPLLRTVECDNTNITGDALASFFAR